MGYTMKHRDAIKTTRSAVLVWITALGIILTAHSAAAEDPASKAKVWRLYQDVVTEKLAYTAVKGDTLLGIAGMFGVDLRYLKAENGLKSDRIHPGDTFRVTRRTIAPSEVFDGILINIPDLTLYLFRDGSLAAHYPVGLGKPDWQTPSGTFRVLKKEENPTWYVPVSIQMEMEEKGEEVKTLVPPGPDNPLGRWALKTSMQGILIHETIAPESVYRFQSHGCIRMRGDDVKRLFDEVSKGDTGDIIYRPVKLALTDNGHVYLEVHRDSYKRSGNPLNTAASYIINAGLYDKVDWEKVSKVATEKEGIAKDITLRAARSTDDGQKELSQGGAGPGDLPGSGGRTGETGGLAEHTQAL
jgi:L,D-transpeptidase ErfK/SrfK